MKRPSRKPSILSESLHRQLNSYGLAASAAGVGMLALAQPADGKIVYTKTHQELFANQRYLLDLNHDGIKDFKFSDVRTAWSQNTTPFSGATAKLAVYGVRSRNKIYGNAKYASALFAGGLIGPKEHFSNGPIMAEVWSDSGRNDGERGMWFSVKHRYLGLEFVIKGKTHFGWARLNVGISQHAEIQATLTGYAYETIPNKPIIAGKTHGKDVVTVQPASLGHLARGSAALAAWRSDGAAK